ncbi:GNAT family N-acetyltransferase [Agrococcus sp. ARC_14]|uniref:GNAT family N-acetyltransferase n=1 Tax=Agrococcus sp. ARC_14 TaxID=2919927 RepID=UPI001F06F6C5|nr:GNAT family N-acetyltransferase [Agrococcus sp. ARC_14]MCH1882552.1 GNAT family N-acetyltransferase [Agrococcus sp. ARC_14]
MSEQTTGRAMTIPGLDIRAPLHDGFVVDTDPDRLDLERVHAWLSTDAYWAMGRPMDVLRRAVAASVNFGVYAADGAQVGYARLVTDGATFGWLCDVYVDRDARGLGVGSALAQTIVDAVAPLRMKRLLLTTADAHGIYAACGFVVHPNPEQVMVRTTEQA